jgi:hypothetical protein
MQKGWSENELRGAMETRIEKARFHGKTDLDLEEMYGLTPETQRQYREAVKNRKEKVLSDAFGISSKNLADTTKMALNLGVSPTFALNNRNLFSEVKKIRSDLQSDPYSYIMEKTKNEAKTLQDAGRIMSGLDSGYRLKDKEHTFNANMGWALEKPLSSLLEKPLFALNQLGWQGIKLAATPFIEDGGKAQRYFDNQINYWSHPELHGEWTPFVNTVENTMQDIADMKGTMQSVAVKCTYAGADLAMMIGQMKMLGGLMGSFGGMPTKATDMIANRGAQALANFKNLAYMHGTHAFLTTTGTLEDRLKAGLYRIAYNSTPIFVNETLGYAGYKAMFADFFSNTLLTSPHYYSILTSDMPNAEKIKNIIPQVIMDFGMSWHTRGNLENQRISNEAKRKARLEGLKDEMADREVNDIFDDPARYEKMVEWYAEVRTKADPESPTKEEIKKRILDFANSDENPDYRPDGIEVFVPEPAEGKTGKDPWDKTVLDLNEESGMSRSLTVLDWERFPELREGTTSFEEYLVKKGLMEPNKPMAEELSPENDRDFFDDDGDFFFQKAREEREAKLSEEDRQKADEDFELRMQESAYRDSVIQAIKDEGGLDHQGNKGIWGEAEAKLLWNKMRGAFNRKKGGGVSLNKMHQVLVSKGIFNGDLDRLYELLTADVDKKNPSALVYRKDVELPTTKDIRADMDKALKKVMGEFGDLKIGDLFRAGGKGIENRISRKNKKQLKGIIKYLTYLNQKADSDLVYVDQREEIRDTLDRIDPRVRADTQKLLGEAERDQIAPLTDPNATAPEKKMPRNVPTTKSDIGLRRTMREGVADVQKLHASDRFYLDKDSLNDMSVKDYLGMALQVKELYEQGRKEWSVRQAARAQADQITESRLLETLGFKKVPEGNQYKGSLEDRREPRIKNKTNFVMAESKRVSRLADEMDGMKNYRGRFYRFLVEKVNLNDNAKLENWYRRKDKVYGALKEAGLKEKELGERLVDFKDPVTGERHTFTIDDALSIAGYEMNHKSALALRYGNGYDDAMIQSVIKALRQRVPHYRKILDAMVADYGDNFGRFRDFLKDYANISLEEEQNYIGKMYRLGHKGKNGNALTDIMDERMDEILRMSSLKKSYAKRSSSHARVEYAEGDEQAPIRLGLYKNWNQSVMENEHLIAHGAHVRKIHKMLGDPNDANLPSVAEGIRQRYGDDYLRVLRDYANRVAIPDWYKSHDAMNVAARTIKRNMAMAYLGYNLLTIAKQVPSLAFYGVAARPQHFLASAWDFMNNPVKTMENIYRLDPQMKERGIERVLEEVKAADLKNWEKIVGKVGIIGMRGIVAMDKCVTMLGWNAVYKKGLAQGLSETDAAMQAQRITLLTQPAAKAKDLPRMLATNNEWLNIYLVFTNQLNQVWNMTTHDVYGYAKKAVTGKGEGGEISHALSYTVALLTAGMMMDYIKDGKMPKDRKEWLYAMTGQPLSSIPLFGKVVTGKIEGFRSGSEPIAKLVEGGFRSIDDIAKGEVDMDTLVSLYQSLALIHGLPYTGPKRGLDVARLDEKEIGSVIETLLGWNYANKGRSNKKGKYTLGSVKL